MFCGQCGTSNPDTNKFCENCGRALIRPRPSGAAPAPAIPFPVATPQQTPQGYTAPPPPPPVYVPAPAIPFPVAASTQAPPSYSAPPPPQPVYAPVQQSNEPIVGIISGAYENQRKLLLVYAIHYTLVITHRRMILARVTDALTTAAQTEAAERSKAEGKGFFGNMADQFLVGSQFSQRYFSMIPEQIIAETPGNIVLENAQISSIKLKGGQGIGLFGVPTDIPNGQLKMIIESSQGVFTYFMRDEKEFTGLLKDVYGERLHMPFGYIAPIRINIKPF